MPRLNKGVVKQAKDGLWYGRVRWTDEDTGKPREKKFPPQKNKTDADTLVENFKSELKTHGGKAVDAAKLKFAQLAKSYSDAKLYEAKIINGRKVGGLKSVTSAQREVDVLTDYFGKRRIKSITHSDVETFKLQRLDKPVVRGKGKNRTETQRTIACVNRELERLRAMMRFAVRQGWLVRSPFEMGEPLISKSDETRRERTLSREEEKLLLDACGERTITYMRRGKKVTATIKAETRLYLRVLIIAALDTGCRRGELLKLRWRDLDFITRTITIIAENSKTARPRSVGMTPRLHNELETLWLASPRDVHGLVFGITNTIKKAFKTVCDVAGLKDFHFHDFRHTAITRMVDTGQPSAVIMKISGHTQHSTFARYVNPNTEAITNVADALAAWQSNQQPQEISESVN